jgi:AcrR family transcriptional regulator
MPTTRPPTPVPVASRQLLGRADRQAAILRGAATAFARAGFADTSMEDVAAASGITKVIVYRHFDSKERLYRAVLELVSNRLAEEFTAALDRRDRPGVGSRSLLAVARENPDGFVLLWRQAAHEPEFRDYAAAQRASAVLAAQLLLGTAEETSDPFTRWEAEAVVSWLVEAVLAWIDHGDPALDEAFLARIASGLQAMHGAWRGSAP